MKNETDFLTKEFVIEKRRRKLLPWWIKIFVWIFLLTTFAIPVGIIFGILGYPFQISLYGLQTNEPLSFIGIGLMSLFLLKGITSYGLWMEKTWVIAMGIVDGFIGILICLFIMFLYPIFEQKNASSISFRLELLVLIPYLYWLFTIKKAWMKDVN